MEYLTTLGENSDELRMSKYGRSLKVFVMGPEFNGLRSIEVVNWSGQAHFGGREHLKVIRKRIELSETGIYFLTGKEEHGDGRTKLYIGETDNFAKRIADHAHKKDWWDNFIVFTSKDLTKGHVRFLEAVFFNLAIESQGTIDLQYSAEPPGARLPEAECAAMDEFGENMRFVIETMGIGLFQEAAASFLNKSMGSHSSTNPNGSVFLLTKKTKGFQASMIVEDDKYILKQGSTITSSPTEIFAEKSGYFKLWKSVTESNAVVRDSENGEYRTAKDITFSSPSAAGAVVFGRNTNGRLEWLRESDGKSLGECQLEDLPNEAA